ncbi:MAG: hypothetical protein WBG93_15205 [Thermoanaerobaculia bacterium]
MSDQLPAILPHIQQAFRLVTAGVHAVSHYRSLPRWRRYSVSPRVFRLGVRLNWR